MKTCKKLLAIALVAAVLLTTLVSGLVVSAAEPYSVTIANTELTAGEDATVNVTVDFNGDAISALHMLATVTTELKIDDAAIVSVDYADNYVDPGDSELEVPALRIKNDGKNLEAGKILFESGVDGAVKATKVVFALTFKAVAEGTYPIAINVESTDYNEANFDAMNATGEIVAKAPHVHEYAEEVTDPTCTDKGFTTYTCTCGDSYVSNYVDALGHKFADGICGVCGAEDPDYEPPVVGPIVDDTLVFAGAAVGYGDSSLQINFRIRNNLLTKYSNMELVIIPQKYDLTTLNLVEIPVEIVIPYAKLSGTGTFRTYAYTDIQLYELGLTIQYMLRGTDANGNAVQSPVYSTSAASYLKGVVPADDYMATLIADTLIMGQSAMENTAASYPESQLAVDAAASILGDYDLSAATKDFDMESCNKVDTHNAVDSNWGVGSTGTHRMSKSVTIGKVPYISYRIRGGSSIDLNKLKIRVTYTTITGSQYDYTFTSADTDNLFKNGSFVMFNFDEIGLGDGDKDVTIVATYDGAEVFNAVYSVETYFYNNMSTLNANIQVLAKNILKLGSSFRANMNK